MRHLSTALLTAAALAASAAPAAAAPQTLAREQAPFFVDAYGDAIAWSSFDPATQRYALRIRRNGTVTTPPVAGRGRAFDVDLGPLPGGGLGAVYSRCADDVRRTGCDLYLLDVDAGTERKLDSVSSPTRSETLPSLEGDRVAFARSYGRDRSVVYTGKTTGRPGSVRQPGPAKGTAQDVELASGHLFYEWADVARGDFGRVSLFRIRRDRAVRMYFTESGGANFSNFVGLTYTGGRVYFAETNQGSGVGNRLYRSTLGATRLDEARGSALYNSVAWTGDRFSAARGLDGPSSLELTDPVVWTKATKLP
jgi:hypothetical protein